MSGTFKPKTSHLNLGVETRLKLNLAQLCLPGPVQKSLYESCLALADGAKSPPLIDLKDLPKKDQHWLVKALNDFRKDYTPSVQPGLGVTGENVRTGFKTLFNYDPSIIPDEVVVYINPDGGAGVGVKFKTDSFKYEFGVHILPPPK